MTVSIAVKPGDKVLFVGYSSAWLERVVKVTKKFAISEAANPTEDMGTLAPIRMQLDRIRPVPEGVTGAVGCYRRSH